MATKAKRAQVLQIAFSSPFHNWHDMIRIPECLTAQGVFSVASPARALLYPAS